MFLRFFFIFLVSLVAVSRCQVENSGSCPAIKPGEIGICAFTCSGDNSCKPGLKCCPTACGGSSCTKPITNKKPAPKPGTCPANEPGTAGICIVECQDDYECKDDLKCCSNPCGGGVCVKSVEASKPVPPPGICPIIKPGEVGTCANMCIGDSSCSPGQLCCPTACGGSHCRTPVPKPPKKPGTCPSFEPGTVGICIVECEEDYECDGDLKCCPNQCGGGLCMNSVESSTPVPKPGNCPAIEPGTGGACANMCDNDSSCPKDLKCCSNACGGTACVKPVVPSPCDK